MELTAVHPSSAPGDGTARPLAREEAARFRELAAAPAPALLEPQYVSLHGDEKTRWGGSANVQTAGQSLKIGATVAGGDVAHDADHGLEESDIGHVYAHGTLEAHAVHCGDAGGDAGGHDDGHGAEIKHDQEQAAIHDELGGGILLGQCGNQLGRSSAGDDDRFAWHARQAAWADSADREIPWEGWQMSAQRGRHIEPRADIPPSRNTEPVPEPEQPGRFVENLNPERQSEQLADGISTPRGCCLHHGPPFDSGGRTRPTTSHRSDRRGRLQHSCRDPAARACRSQ
jgi:hypothetical protein